MHGPDACGSCCNQIGARVHKLKAVIITASVFVFLVCVYSFLLGNKVFEGGFENEPIPWYFLAKGVFCSLALVLLFKILEALKK